MATLKIGKCNGCGTLVDFDFRYEKGGWINHENGKRTARCPRCDYAMTEGVDTATIATEEE